MKSQAGIVPPFLGSPQIVKPKSRRQAGKAWPTRVRFHLYLSFGLRFDSVIQMPKRDVRHLDGERMGPGKPEVVHQAANASKKIVDSSRRIVNPRHPLRPGKQCEESNTTIPSSCRTREGIVAPQHPGSLAKAIMFDADQDVDPGFESAVVSQCQLRPRSCEYRLDIQIWRDTGPPRISQESDPRLASTPSHRPKNRVRLKLTPCVLNGCRADYPDWYW